jgi:serine/threonine protein phosphatase 1
MGRVLVVGDIHGAHLALQQVLDRSRFDKENDILITLGDIADGWPYVKECVDILLPLKRIDIIGNHDEWFKEWLTRGVHPQYWMQGGEGTAKSYLRVTDSEHLFIRNTWERGFTTSLNPGDIDVDHWKFFMHQNLYYHDTERNYFFCHAGWDRENLVSRVREICPYEFYWDRELWQKAMSAGPDVKLKTADNFDCVFIGHTATTNWSAREKATKHGIIIPQGGKIDWPLYMGGIWNLDTGAGWSGRLTIMDVDTKQYWQSDQVEHLYPDETVRRTRT